MIDLSTIEQQLLQALGIAILALITWAIKLLVTKLKLQNAADVTNALDDAAGKAIQFGVVKAQDVITAKGWDHVDTHSAITNTAAQYMVDKFPGALKAAGIDPSTDDGKQKIADLVTRALPQGVLDASHSPATPPTPVAPKE